MRASLGDVGKRAPADVHDAHKPRGYERAQDALEPPDCGETCGS